jgi:hypothetical protein
MSVLRGPLSPTLEVSDSLYHSYRLATVARTAHKTPFLTAVSFRSRYSVKAVVYLLVPR